MHTSHYPSLEPCRKLTEIGFPDTQLCFCNSEYRNEIDFSITRLRYGKVVYVCPNVMEMLDVIPENIGDVRDGLQLNLYKDGCSYTENLIDDVDYTVIKFEGGLPNALAEMVLWLHENKYISFSK